MWFMVNIQDSEVAPKIEPLSKVSFLERIRLERLAKESFVAAEPEQMIELKAKVRDSQLIF